MNALDFLREFAAQMDSGAAERPDTRVNDDEQRTLGCDTADTPLWIHPLSDSRNDTAPSRTGCQLPSIPLPQAQQQFVAALTMQASNVYDEPRSSYEAPYHQPAAALHHFGQYSPQHPSAPHNYTIYDPLPLQPNPHTSHTLPWDSTHDDNGTLNPADMRPWEVYGTSSYTLEDIGRYGVLDACSGQGATDISQAQCLEEMCGVRCRHTPLQEQASGDQYIKKEVMERHHVRSTTQST